MGVYYPGSALSNAPPTPIAACAGGFPVLLMHGAHDLVAAPRCGEVWGLALTWIPVGMHCWQQGWGLCTHLYPPRPAPAHADMRPHWRLGWEQGS